MTRQQARRDAIETEKFWKRLSGERERLTLKVAKQFNQQDSTYQEWLKQRENDGLHL